MILYSKKHTWARLLINCCLLLCLATVTNGQSNISGIINTYYPVTSITPAQSRLDVTSAAGLSLYDYVMIVQMKGASVNTTNTSSFGSITAYNDAGNYEINVICGFYGNQVYMLNKFSNTYDPVNGFVQLVKIPSYANANVTAPLLAQSWNKSTGTGGVLALMVNGTLTLQSDIIATDNGFKGGNFELLNGLCSNFFYYTNYFYDTTALNNGGAPKGEGIAELTTAYSGGRGANASGGGGGNDHNTGGGGGGNLGDGGNGGQNTSSVGCRGNFPGVGAYALSSAGNRIFLGGGGGTGHANNAFTTGGGNGGGIVLIKASSLVGNGHMISSNGSKGTSTKSDGASGGGGGGTILMDVTTYTGAVNVEAMGGAGGDVDNMLLAGRCYGTGGGGSGGVIYYTGAIPGGSTSTVTIGSAGISSNGNPGSCNGTSGAGSGTGGSVVANYTLTVSNVPETYCNILLSSKYVTLSVNSNSQLNTLLKWQVLGIDNALYFSIEKSVDGLSWKEMGRTNFDRQLSQYQFNDMSLKEGGACYRIKAILPTGNLDYSNVVCSRASATASWSVLNNPVRDFVYLVGFPRQVVHLLMYDGTGKLIKQFNSLPLSGSVELNVAGLSKGVYYIRCNGIVKPFLKQ